MLLTCVPYCGLTWLRVVVMQCGSWVKQADCSRDIQLVIQLMVLVELAGFSF